MAQSMRPVTQVETQDRRFPLHDGAGRTPCTPAPSTPLRSRAAHRYRTVGCGITLTLGRGNRLVCDVIEQLGRSLAGREIEELMAEFGAVSKRLADHPALRWLGPHKGVSTWR